MNAIHVTGTKGKGSTCAFVQSILAQYQTGEPNSPVGKIGLYTSPHLKSVRERIRINGEPITKEQFTKYFFEVYDAISKTETDLSKFPDMGEGIKPNYFRFLTLLSFHVFLREGVTSAIYEVGIGGEHDSTNILEAPTATGISSLGIDHTAILGNTIEEIAWNKGGIYKHSARALSVRQPENALKVLKDRATERKAEFVVLDPSKSPVKEVKLGLPARFQYINATLAVDLAKDHLTKLGIDGIDLNPESPLPEKFVKGLETATWPGRCQTINDGRITWHLDGAHTKESLTETGLWYQTIHDPEAAHHVLLFNQQTRDANSLIGTLVENLGGKDGQTSLFDHALFSTNVTWSSGNYSAELTSLNTSKDDVDHLVVQKALSETWGSLEPGAERHVYASIQEAIEFIQGLDGKVQVLVAGSLHLVGGVLAVFDGPDAE